jgi:hypothetical protein
MADDPVDAAPLDVLSFGDEFALQLVYNDTHIGVPGVIGYMAATPEVCRGAFGASVYIWTLL